MPSLLPARLKISRTPKGRSCPAHRAWVRRHHCVVPGCDRYRIECAHIRKGTDGGIGLKPSDCYVVSLCDYHHAEQHRIGEQRFEEMYDLDLLAIAREFARLSPHRARLLSLGPLA